MIWYLIDINVRLEMTWDQRPQHANAVRWYDSIDDADLRFCRFTQLGFLRLLTNEKVMGGSTATVSGALELYDRWKRDPRVELALEPRRTEALFRQSVARFGRLSATKAIADCYLVGFAEAAGAQLVTFDKGLAVSARHREVAVTLIHPM